MDYRTDLARLLPTVACPACQGTGKLDRVSGETCRKCRGFGVWAEALRAVYGAIYEDYLLYMTPIDDVDSMITPAIITISTIASAVKPIRQAKRQATKVLSGDKEDKTRFYLARVGAGGLELGEWEVMRTTRCVVDERRVIWHTIGQLVEAGGADQPFWLPTSMLDWLMIGRANYTIRVEAYTQKEVVNDRAFRFMGWRVCISGDNAYARFNTRWVTLYG